MKTVAARIGVSVLFGVLVSSLLLAADSRHSKSDATNGSQSDQPNIWRAVGRAPPAIEVAIAAHARSHTIYIGGAGAAILKSTNGGAPFVAIDNGPFGPLSMVMDPNDPNVVYAGGAK